MKAHSSEYIYTLIHRLQKPYALHAKEWNIKPLLTGSALLENAIIHTFIYSISNGDVEQVTRLKMKWDENGDTRHSTYTHTRYDKSSQVHIDTYSHKTTFRWRTCFECTNQASAGWLLRATHTLHTMYAEWVVRKPVTICQICEGRTFFVGFWTKNGRSGEDAVYHFDVEKYGNWNKSKKEYFLLRLFRLLMFR